MKDTKKIGLVSVSNHNYGSLLQTYAMQQVLNILGVENEIINYKQKSIRQLKRVKNYSFLKQKWKSLLRNLKCKIFYPDTSKGLLIRSKAFNEFKSGYCKYSPLITDRRKLEDYVRNYAAIILGSDQVWHPANMEMDYFTLSFVPDGIPKIAYAPSFGVSQIPKKYHTRVKNYLKRINDISVRESTGAVIVQHLIGKKVPVVCDPTALLTKEHWDRIRSQKAYLKEKYIFCYFLGKNSEHREFANKVKEITGYKIVALQHLDELVKSDISFGDVTPFDVGPRDFINLIANAEIVLTDSFHATMFSIYYHKKFYTFSRFDEKKKESTNSRIDAILCLLGLKERHYTGKENLSSSINKTIDWDRVDKALDRFREQSMNYLLNALNKHNLICKQSIDKSVSKKIKNQCTACTACKFVCPLNCIQFKMDEEGFFYPEVDSKKCIQCGICSDVCPVDNKGLLQRGTAYVARNVEKNIRMKSSSGGIFYSLAEWVLGQKGVVVGAAFDERMKVCHVLVDNLEQVRALQGSKYVQSDLENIFPQIKEALKAGRLVLFCGTPCQAAGLKHFLREPCENLILVDVLCYGVPSPGIFSKFVKYLEGKHKSKMCNFYFRDKTYGYSSPNVKAEFKNGDIEEMTSDVKSFTKTFFLNVNVRPSCFNCSFKGIARETDFTLGDFWSVRKVKQEMDDDTGVTLVFAHTPKAVNILLSMNDVEIKEIPYNDAVSFAGPMMVKCPIINTKRVRFFNSINSEEYIQCVNECCPDSINNKMANVLKPLLLKSGLLEIGLLKIVKEKKIIREKVKYQ